MLLAASACGTGNSDDSSSTEATTTEPAGDSEAEGESVDPAAFFEGALTEEAATADCTLADGTETSCYELTIAGFPATRDEIGPWCPQTTSDPAAGIWFDGESVYDIDGQFISDLAEIYDDPTWHLFDEDGNVLSTDTAEKFNELVNGGAQTEADPVNQCVYGEIEWTEGGGPISTTVEIPVTPTRAAGPTAASGVLGVTLDGVLIENSAPIDLILGNYTIGAFDPCGGHVNPQEGYHMHATTGCSDSDEAVPDGETARFGYALDGYAIHAPFTEDVEADAGLDECNGHETEELGYHYHANQVAENAVLTCFSGTTTAAADGPGGGGGPPPDAGEAPPSPG